MAKQVTAQVKLQCPGGSATPAPPVGPALGAHGVNIGMFKRAAEVAELFGRLAVGGKFFRGGFRMAVVHIAHGHDVAVLPGVVGVARAHATAADERDTRAAVRAGDGRIGFCGFKFTF